MGGFTQGLTQEKQASFDNTLLLDADGHVTEGPGFNVFIIKDGQVATPRSGVLKGATRQVSMELCASLGNEVSEKVITLIDLLVADDVFATTTRVGLLPITRINQHTYSNDVRAR